MQIDEIKDQICDVCHKMWQLGWVAANDGNVSVRLDDGTFLATPTGMSKSFITPDKLLRIDCIRHLCCTRCSIWCKRNSSDRSYILDHVIHIHRSVCNCKTR